MTGAGPRVLLVTTMNTQGYMRYGKRMLASMSEQLQPGVAMRLYAEDFTPDPLILGPQIAWCDLNEAAPWLVEFKAWCDLDPRRCGRQHGGGYGIATDARRFSHKIAAFTHAALDPDLGYADIIGWCDGDTIAHAPIDAGWLSGLMNGAYLAWLDRIGNYPECGFFLTDPHHPMHGHLWEEVRALYTTRSIIQLEQWHDCLAIQHVMERAEREGHIRLASLSGDKGRRTSHPLVNGPLGARLDHLKGPRKDEGRSRPADLRTRRDEPYWTRK